MEKNSNSNRNSNSSCCPKPSKQFAASQAAHKILVLLAVLQIIHHHHNHLVLRKSLISNPKHILPKTKRHGTPRDREAAETVPVNYDYSSQSIPANGKSKPATPLPPIPNTTLVANRPKFESPQRNELEEGSDKQGTHIEERFADYINRARIKIRSLSNAGHEKQHASPGKDKFTDYINRAKVKLRTTSSIGGGKP
ncbi:hypothetical protein OIU76_005333 [Salix suchowensis]|nr:hypothetical protein OIU76_005333 [Salix suchowensis]